MLSMLFYEHMVASDVKLIGIETFNFMIIKTG